MTARAERSLSISRRYFLHSGLAALAAPFPLRAALPANPDVVVIGSGMAGLAAARTLQAAGLSVGIFEARGRIGGRAYTERDSFGVPFDHGCAWLNSHDHNPITALAGDYGFETQLIRRNPRLFGPKGLVSKSANGAYETALGTLRANVDEAGAAGRDVAVSDVYAAQGPWERLASEVASRLAFGVEPDHVSVIDSHNRVASAQDALLPRGLGSLVTAYGLGLPVALKTPVETVRWSGPGVTLTTNRGDVRARAVLITVSAGVLKNGALRFEPGLPTWKREAVDGLSMGLVNKVALQYRRETLDLAPGTWLVGRDSEGRSLAFLVDPFGGGMAIAFVGAALAGSLEQAGARASIDYARSVLSGILGSDIDQGFRRARVTGWASDPWARGSFSAARPGHARMRRVLSLPVGDRIYFAGEATHSTWAGLLPGAYLSGIESARRIIADLR